MAHVLKMKLKSLGRRQAVLHLCSEYVTKIKQCKSMVKQYEDLKETCQTLRIANVNLMGEVDVVNKKLRSTPQEEHSDKDKVRSFCFLTLNMS